jgi:hypothetical protein
VRCTDGAARRLRDSTRLKKKKAKRAAAQQEVTPEPTEEPGLWDSLVGWVEDELEPEPAPLDPEDAPVRCRIGKRETFSSLSDCHARGGKPVSREPAQ